MQGKFYAKECGLCKEIMPMYEKQCYCGGPIKIVQAKSDLKDFVDSYHTRKWLSQRRGK